MGNIIEQYDVKGLPSPSFPFGSFHIGSAGDKIKEYLDSNNLEAYWIKPLSSGVMHQDKLDFKIASKKGVMWHPKYKPFTRTANYLMGVDPIQINKAAKDFSKYP